jgi:chromosome segregation protein
MSLLQITEPGIRAVMQDWLADIYTATDMTQALAAAPARGAQFVVAEGHLVGRNAIQIYAADSEAGGMLAREQEIENLQKQARAQMLLSDEARTQSVRAESAYTHASAVLIDTRSRAEQATRRVHALQMDVLKLSQAMERFSARSNQIREELAEIDAQIDEQRAIRAESEASFEQHDAQLADMQASHEDQQMAFEGMDAKLSGARQQLRDLERAAQEAVFAERNLAGRIDELRRNIQMAGDQSERIAESLENARANSKRSTSRPPTPACRKRWKCAREGGSCPPRVSNSTRSRPSCASSTNSAWPPSAACSRCATASPNASSRSRPRA